MKQELGRKLSALERRGLRRRRRVIGSPQGAQLVVDGRPMLAFGSNDYLGLAGDPRVAKALAEAADRWGAGSGAAHLISGHSAAHHALEEALAVFTGRPRALLFSTGYIANLAVVTALAGRGDVVLEDRLNHASLLDAGLLSGARFMRYAHGDPADARRRLAARKESVRMLITDGVFSMDGDVAPLRELADVAREHGAWLMVDDAHGLGVLGDTGGGCLQRLGLDTQQAPVLMGTLGKAFGTAGAFVAGDEELIEWLIHRARPYIYTTAQPPAVAAATRVALDIVQKETWRRNKLHTLIQRFRQGAAQRGLDLMPSYTPIQPIVVGGNHAALAWAEALEAQGILVTPIRPPTVPEGEARLRITLSAAHEEAHVDRLLDALQRARDAFQHSEKELAADERR